MKKRLFLNPVRLAASGNPNGPSLYHLIEVLGKETVMQRIKSALFKI